MDYKILHGDCHWCYPVELEEAFDLFAFPSGAAHQEVTELVYWSQLLKNVTPLKEINKEKILYFHVCAYDTVLSH